MIQAGKTEFNKNNNILFSNYFKDPLTHNLLNKDWDRARLSNCFYKLDVRLCGEGNTKNHNEYLQHPKSSKVQVVKTGEVHRCGIDEAINISSVLVVTASKEISLGFSTVIERTKRHFSFYMIQREH